MTGTTAAVAMSAGPIREQLVSELPGLDVAVSLSRTDRDWQALAQDLTRVTAEVLFVDLNWIPEPIDRALEALLSAAPGTAIVAIDGTATPETVVAVLRAGAAEVLAPPLNPGLRQCMARIARLRGGVRGSVRSKGRILGFVAVKGGCGATTVMCHFGAELQRQSGQKVLLADFDLDAGLVGFLMKCETAYSVLDAAGNTHRLDASFWKALVGNGTPNLEILTAPEWPLEGSAPSADEFRSVLRFARTLYDWVLVDLGRSLSPLAQRALDDIDETFVVTTPDVPALYGAKRLVRALVASGYGRSAAEPGANGGYTSHRLRLVLNRVPRRGDMPVQDLEKMVGLAPYAELPADDEALYEACAAGRLLPESAPLRRAIKSLAARAAGIAEPSHPRRFRFFG